MSSFLSRYFGVGIERDEERAANRYNFMQTYV